MSSIALSTIRQRMCEQVGMWHSYTATSAGESDGSTIVCNTLDYPDDGLQDYYVKVTSGSTLETRKIKNNYYNEGIIRPYVAFSAQIATAVTFEIHHFDPTNFTSYINDAIRDVYPNLSKQIVNSESLVGGNLLPTAVFDEWATATYPDYTTRDTVTAAEETTNVLFAASSMKLSTAAGSVYYTSDSWKPLLNLAGATPYYYRWVKCSTASVARIFITTVTNAGTATTTYSDYHTGAGEWELLRVTASIPYITVPSATTDLAEVRLGCATATTGTAYFCKGFVGGTVEEYLMPNDFDTVNEIYSCNYWYDRETIERVRAEFEVRNKTGTKYLWIKNAGYEDKLELLGRSAYTALAAETSTIDLDTNWQRIIVFASVANMLRAQATPLSSKDIKEPLALAENYDRRVEELKRKYDKRPPSKIGKWM